MPNDPEMQSKRNRGGGVPGRGAPWHDSDAGRGCWLLAPCPLLHVGNCCEFKSVRIEGASECCELSERNRVSECCDSSERVSEQTTRVSELN
jgi:hypothetical protein